MSRFKLSSIKLGNRSTSRFTSDDTELQRRSRGTPVSSSSVDMTAPRAASPKRKLPELNEDLYYLILEHAYFNGRTLRPDFHNFTRYALVARAWRRPAQALLFHEISVKDEKAYKSLSSVFEDTSDHAKWLRACTRVLNYWIFSGGKHSASTWESRLPTTMRSCPQLYELRLGVDAIQKLNSSTISALNESSPPIRALQIAMRSDENGKSAMGSEVPCQIITSVTAWKLEFLVMRGDSFALSSYTKYPSVSHQLVEFRWTIPKSTTVETTYNDFITWVTQSSTKTLEILHLPGGHPVINLVGNGLRSLRVSQMTDLTIPNQLKGLRELILTNPGVISTEVAYYSKLPPNLVHLGLTTNIYLVGATLADQLKHKLPQKLHTLSIYYSQATARYGNAIGTSRYIVPGEDVEIVVFNGFEAAQVAMRSDLVRSKGYPRGVTLDNMRYMSRIVANNEDRPEKGSKRTFGSSWFQRSANPAPPARLPTPPAPIHPRD